VTPEHRAFLVKQRAAALGFTTTGIADLAPVPHAAELRRWLERGLAGTMRYMHRQAERRLEPARILAGATRAVVVTRDHYRPDPPRRAGTGRIARYARGRDYHESLRAPLEQLAAYLRSLGGPDTVARWYVDHGPVPERELAQRAGLGWIGKNTMLIDPRRGSYLFLAAVLTNLDLAVDPPFEADRCGSCRRCLDACPTGAFPAERVLDARRCISYLTIEHRGDIDPALRPAMGDWIFGCDVCQEVCPWNEKFAAETDDEVLGYDPSLAQADLEELVQLPQEEVDRRYGWTALERAGASGLRRNARIALENARHEAPCPTSPTP
jgi:epoxyqueuosine reductase